MDNEAKVLKVLHEEYSDAKYYLDFKNPLQLVVAAILSPQVRDEVVNAATPKLFKKYKTAKDFARADPDELVEYISDISYSGNKAKYIVASCKKIVEEHDGKVPDTFDELVELKGVGTKTAHAILQNAFGKVEGIPVDTHVQRVAYRLGWTKHKSPDKVMKNLMARVQKKSGIRFRISSKRMGARFAKRQRQSAASAR